MSISGAVVLGGVSVGSVVFLILGTWMVVLSLESGLVLCYIVVVVS